MDCLFCLAAYGRQPALESLCVPSFACTLHGQGCRIGLGIPIRQIPPRLLGQLPDVPIGREEQGARVRHLDAILHRVQNARCAGNRLSD